MMHFRTNFEQCVIDSRIRNWIIFEYVPKINRKQILEKNSFLDFFSKTKEQNPELRLPESITNLRIYIRILHHYRKADPLT